MLFFRDHFFHVNKTMMMIKPKVEIPWRGVDQEVVWPCPERKHMPSDSDVNRSSGFLQAPNLMILRLVIQRPGVGQSPTLILSHHLASPAAFGCHEPMFWFSGSWPGC
jgi:hypothetical protein